MRNLLILFFALFLGLNYGISQQFPITVIPQLAKPSPVYINNYADDSTINTPIQLRLLLNDITANNEQIRLKIFVEGNGISFESRDFVNGIAPIFIDGGTPLLLNNFDLAPYFQFQNIMGINSNVYGAALPEGNYQFCFEIFGAITNNRLSSKTCVSTYIFNNEPPLLNLPFNEVNIEPKEVENIVFQWTPRHINVSNVEYELSMVEIWDDMVDPRTAFLTSPPFFQTTTRMTTFIYGPSQPLLLADKRYAWQVRAKALQGIEEVGLFRNEGESEIFWFSRTEPCKAPNSVFAEAKGKTKINIFWEEDRSLFQEYTIEYKEANDANAEWFSITTNSSWATIWHLKPATTYEFKVQGKCKFQKGNFSEIQEVTTANDEDESANYNCGIVPDIEAVSNRTPHQGLQIGDSVTAGDFIVTITEITSQSNGILSGTGFVKIPYLKYARFAVKFEGILVNTDKQLAQGEIVTLYDPFFGEDATMTLDVDVELKESITGDQGDKFTGGVDFVITEVITRDNGATIIKGENGEEQTIPGGIDAEITDSKGATYSVSESGEVTKGQEAEGGPATVSNTNGITEEGVSEVSDIGVRVDFMDSGFYSYDEVSVSVKDILKEYYPPIKIGDNEYQVPYKAVGLIEGADFIEAKVDITNEKYTIEDVIFKTKDGIKIEASWEASVAKLSLKQKFDYALEDIIATVVSKEDTEKQEVIGAFKLVHLSTLEANLTIIPLNNARLESGLAESVNQIYHKAGVHFNTTVDSSVDLSGINWDVDGDGKLEVGDSSIISFYTPEQKVIINHIKSQSTYDPNTYYMFVGDMAVSKSGVNGFMPLGEQFGFVFGASNQERTLAHELGHGAFGLEHPFTEYKTPQGATDYLMDYGSGIVINHMDWKKIHAGGFQFNWLQGDDDGENSTYQSVSDVKNKMPELLAHIKENMNGGNNVLKWREFIKHEKSTSGNRRVTSYEMPEGEYNINVDGEKCVFNLIKQPEGVEEIKTFSNDVSLEIKTVDLLTNVIYQLTVKTEKDQFVFEFDTHDDLEVFANYLKIDRNQRYTEPNQSNYSKQIITYLKDNHLTTGELTSICENTSLYLKEVPSDYLANSSEEKLWAALKRILICKGGVNDKGISEEDILIKLVEILGNKNKDKNIFFYELETQKSLNYTGGNLFKQLYQKIDNWGGADNFTRLMNAFYEIWKETDYATKESIDEIPYQVEKKFGFYNDNYSVEFNEDYTKIEVKEDDTSVATYEGKRGNYEKTIGKTVSYGVYEPITLTKYEQLIEKGDGFEAPNVNIPVFMLKAIVQNQKAHNVDLSANLAFDAALTFTGVGNIAKLRHLKNLKDLGKLEAFLIGAQGVESLGSTLSFLLKYSDNCGVKVLGETTFCEKLEMFTSTVGLAGGFTTLAKKTAAIKSSKELLEEVKKGGVINDPDDLKAIIKGLEDIINIDLDDLSKLKSIIKLGPEQWILNYDNFNLAFSTVDYLVKYTDSCNGESELCKEIKLYLGIIKKVIDAKKITTSLSQQASKLLDRIDANPSALTSNQLRLDETRSELKRVAEVGVTWQNKLKADLAILPSLKVSFDKAVASGKQREFEDAYEVLSSFPIIRSKTNNIETLMNVSDRFVYSGLNGKAGLIKLIVKGSPASKQKLIDGLAKANTLFPKDLPVVFSGIKKGEVTVLYDTSIMEKNSTKQEIARYTDDNNGGLIMLKKKIIPADNQVNFQPIQSYKGEGILLRKGDEIGFKAE